MWLDLIALLIQLFPDELGPYTLNDITVALREAYGPRSINYARVHYAWSTLYDDVETRSYVRPLKSRQDCLRFNAGAARNIAKRAIKGKLPSTIEKLQAMAQPIHAEPCPPTRHRPQAYKEVPR